MSTNDIQVGDVITLGKGGCGVPDELADDTSLAIAVKFLNDNFSPWEFAGDEPVAIALAKILRELADENDELRQQLDNITDDVVMYTAPEAVKQGDTVMVRVPRRYTVKP